MAIFNSYVSLPEGIEPQLRCRTSAVFAEVVSISRTAIAALGHPTSKVFCFGIFGGLKTPSPSGILGKTFLTHFNAI